MALENLRRQADLPAEYLELLANSNGGEGCLDIAPYSFVLDPAEKAAAHHQARTYGKHAPGLFVFGGDGGNRLIAFDMRDSKPWPIVAIDLDHPDPAASMAKVTADFALFLTHIGVQAPAN